MLEWGKKKKVAWETGNVSFKRHNCGEWMSVVSHNLGMKSKIRGNENERKQKFANISGGV